MKKNSN